MNYLDVEQLIEDRRRGLANYHYWPTHTQWTLPQAAYLLLGREPLPNNEAGEYQPGENLLLVMQQYPLPELITPPEAVQWFARCYPMYALPPELAGLLEESQAARPTSPQKLTNAEIESRLRAGASMTQIRQDTGVSRGRIRQVKKKHGIENATPGPKPKHE